MIEFADFKLYYEYIFNFYFQEEKATATVMFQKIANAYEVSKCFSCCAFNSF